MKYLIYQYDNPLRVYKMISQWQSKSWRNYRKNNRNLSSVGKSNMALFNNWYKKCTKYVNRDNDFNNKNKIITYLF